MKTNRKQNFTTEEINEILELYKTAQATTPDIMKKYNISRKRALKLARQNFGSEYTQIMKKIHGLGSVRAGKTHLGKKTGPHSAEWNKKISDAHIGMKVTEKTKEKISQTLNQKWNDGTFSHEEAKARSKKIVEVKRKRGYFEIFAKEHSIRMSINHPMKGKKHNEKTKLQMKLARKHFFANGGQVWIKGKTHNFKTKEKCRIATLDMWKSGKFRYGSGKVFRSKLEISIFEEFQKFDKNVKHSYSLIAPKRTYNYDIFIPSLNLIIEVNGDYWHYNPKFYSSNHYDKSRKIYVKDIWNTDIEKINLAKNQNYNVITVWENEIKNSTPQKIVENIITQSHE